MRLLLIFVIALLQTSSILFAQSQDQLSNSFPESTADSTIFRIYLDSADHHLFSDLNLSEKYIQSCKTILEQGTIISPSQKRLFLNVAISYESNINNHIKAYQILNEHRDFLRTDVPEFEKQEVKLSEGYILFSLGELESAQKIYQSIIRWSEENNDEDILISGYYYLAQIQSSQENYKDAEKNFLKIHEIEMKDSIQDVNQLTTIYELSNLYFNLENNEKTNYYDSLGLSIAQKLKNPIFIFEFLNNKTESAIKNKQFAEAKKLIEKSKKIIYKIESTRHFQTHLQTNAEFQSAQKKYPEALKIYEHLLAIDSKEDPNHTINLYEKAHELYRQVGDNDMAYHFLLKTKTTQDSVFNQKKIQQVNFLNTKFEAEQKEKENQLLTSQVLQKQTTNKYLLALAFISIFGILGLFGAYYQKQRYNRHLKKEIKIQTKELQNTNQQLIQSNEELAQFNNILSHDLIEPLRSIVGFCTLAKKQVAPDHKIIEFLQYIEKGGKQLFTLIEDVSEFNNIEKIDPNKIVSTDLNELLESISNKLHSFAEEKEFQLNYSSFPTINTNKIILFLVLKNLIENGIKYNKNKFAIIDIEYREKNQEHILVVQDNGIGIDKEFHTKIFGMFKRLNNRGEYSGSGLGLSLVQKTIQKIDGRVSLLYSEVGKGSIFEIRFPIKEISANAKPVLEIAEA